MNKQNRSIFSNKENQPTVKEAEVKESKSANLTKEEIDNLNPHLFRKDEEPVKEEQNVTKPVKACVTGCDKLYVRSKPEKGSDAITTIDKDDQVIVLDMNASDEFYKVETKNGTNGYCMKTYMAIMPEV